MSGIVVAGFGCRRDCPADAIVALFQRARSEIGRPVDALAVPRFKRAEPGLQEAARRLGLTLILVEPAPLAAAQARCVTHSVLAARTVGVGSVAEGSALAAAGADARLILPRIAGDGATCAVAMAGAT